MGFSRPHDHRQGRLPEAKCPGSEAMKQRAFGAFSGAPECTLEVPVIKNGSWQRRRSAVLRPQRVELPDAAKCHGPPCRALSDQFKLHFGFPQEIAESAGLVIPIAKLVEVDRCADRHCFSEVIQNETRG